MLESCVELVILDLYGTIIEQGLDQSPVKYVKETMHIEKPFPLYIEQFQATFQTLRHVSLEQGFHLVADDFDKELDQATFDDLVDAWHRNAEQSELYDDTRDAIAELRDDHTVVLAANVDEYTFEHIDDAFDIRGMFDDTYLSYETGYLKSGDDNLNAITKDHGVTTDQVLYAGDSMASDVKPAKRFGFDAVLVDRRDTRDYRPKVHSLEALTDYV